MKCVYDNLSFVLLALSAYQKFYAVQKDHWKVKKHIIKIVQIIIYQIAVAM